MPEYFEQVQRIKDKLNQARRRDQDLKVFGADRHAYHLNDPVSETEVGEFEQKYGISLPECYRAFITKIGNGGTGYANSGAGPFYGIYPMGEHVTELIFENPEKYLKSECLIYPEMTADFWISLTKDLEADEVPDEAYEEEIGKLFGGILPIGSQGCTYIHGIVLNGPNKGRVVNLDMDRQKPFFGFETNFLDWYERWLDEVISGKLIQNRLNSRLTND
jgi:hypothetical protein